MTDRTPRFGLTTLDSPLDRLDFSDWKFGVSDRQLLDRLLNHAVEHHRHDGTANVVNAPGAPTLALNTEGGILPPGSTIYYRYSLVDDRSQEQLASALGVIRTPVQLPVPPPPTVAIIAGALDPGMYVYAVSAVTNNASTQETTLSRTVAILVRAGQGVRITSPTRPPSGSTGMNVYRKGPRDPEFYFVESTGLDYIDDTSITSSDQDHRAPETNTTFTTNSVTVTPPEGTTGASWKAFRSFDPTDWSNSLVNWLGVFSAYIDTGHATRRGAPTFTSAAVAGAAKIQLEDMGEVEGFLPPGRNLSSQEITFTNSGLVTPGHDTWMWVNEFAACELVSLRAVLGRGFAPAAQALICSVEVSVAGGDWVDATTGNVCTIPVGEQTGSLVAVTPSTTLVPGDALRLTIRQSGGGVTPTDYDLVVTAMCAVRHGSTTTTYEWSTH